jgi:hypothetical protein
MLIRLLCIEYGVSDRQEAMAVWYDGRRFWATHEIAPQKGGSRWVSGLEGYEEAEQIPGGRGYRLVKDRTQIWCPYT